MAKNAANNRKNSGEGEEPLPLGVVPRGAVLTPEQVARVRSAWDSNGVRAGAMRIFDLLAAGGAGGFGQSQASPEDLSTFNSTQWFVAEASPGGERLRLRVDWRGDRFLPVVLADRERATRPPTPSEVETKVMPEAKVPSPRRKLTSPVEDVLVDKHGQPGPYTVATLLATLAELDIANYYSNQIHELLAGGNQVEPAHLQHIELKPPRHHFDAEEKLADPVERVGYRLVLEHQRVVGYAGLLRIPLGHCPEFKPTDDGGDPRFADAVKGAAPGVTDGCISALRLHHTYRRQRRWLGIDEQPALAYRIRLIIAVEDILLALAARKQFIAFLWAAPGHRDEIQWFDRLRSESEGAVRVYPGDARNVYRIQLWPWVLSDAGEYSLARVKAAYEPYDAFIRAGLEAAKASGST